MARELAGNELYQFYKGGNKEKHRWFLKRKTPVSQDAVSVSEEAEAIEVKREIKEEIEQEIQETEKTIEEAPESEERLDGGAEDMLAVMERYRLMATSDADTPIMDTKGTDLLILMGNYLKTVDL